MWFIISIAPWAAKDARSRSRRRRICEAIKNRERPMKFFSICVRTFVSAGALALAAQGAAEAPKTVWFDAPATRFTEGSPIGNGRLGAVVFGGITEERLVLNESGMWSGSPQQADRQDAAAALPEIRRLLVEGKNAEAEKLVNEYFTC